MAALLLSTTCSSPKGSISTFPYKTLKLGIYPETYTEIDARKSSKVSEKTSEKIKKMMSVTPSVTIKEIADVLDRQPRTIEIAIRKLKASGEIIREGSDKDGTWKVLK